MTGVMSLHDLWLHELEEQNLWIAKLLLENHLYRISSSNYRNNLTFEIGMISLLTIFT